MRRIFSRMELMMECKSPRPPGGVPALKPQQKTQIENLQNVRYFRRVSSGKYFLQILEECFAGELIAVKFGLQRAAGPIGKRGMPATQHRFVEKSDHRENRQPDILDVVTSRQRILFRGVQSLFHLRRNESALGTSCCRRYFRRTSR